MIYVGFHQPPLILVITLQNRKTLFCVFWHFRNLLELKLTWDFLGINILSREPSRAQEVNEVGHEGQTRLGGMGPRPGRATQARLSLKAPMSSIFVSWSSAWPKNDYIKTPQRRSLREGAEKHETQKQRLFHAKIGGGNTAGVAPGWFSNLSDITTIDPTMKRE
jgi:hypothetical protein